MTISRLVFAAIVLLPFLNGPVSSQTAPQSGSDTNSKPFTFERFKDELSKAKDKKHRLQLIDVANVQGSTNVDAMMLIANFFWKSGEESDYEKAIEYLQKAESLGSVEAALRLAQIYSSGKQVSPNEQLALFHYETAANAGDNTARIKVADAYLRGSIVVGDTAKAVDLLDKASSSGSGLAALRLGDFYRAGSKGELARSYYEHAASLGMNDALVKLGDVYREGLLVPEGAAKAFELYEKALELKVPLAYSRVGDSLVRGNGVKPDVPRGLSLLGVAAENGNYSAARLLGDFFSNSDYTKRDVSKAIDFYQIAGRSGDGLAYLRLGELYRDGKFVSKDNKKALFYISKAVELGDKRAEVILGQSHIQGKFGSLSSKQKGVKLISNARMKGELTAAPTIAYLYAAGAFGRKDNQKALSILTAEVKRGSAPAVLALVSLYRDGKRGVIAPNQLKAVSVLKEYGGTLKPQELAREEILVSAAFAKTGSDYEAVAVQLDATSTFLQRDALNRMIVVNANVFVYFAQRRLNEYGLMSSRPNGKLDAPTVAALKKLCSLRSSATACFAGPLSRDGGRALTSMLLIH